MKDQLVLLTFLVLLFNACVENTTKEEQSELNEPEIVQENVASQDQPDYVQVGKSIAMETQQLLAKHLMQAIQDSGMNHAMQFCSAQAYPLTDSMSQAFGVTIKRVTHKARNPQNKANPKEKLIIEGYMDQLKQGEMPGPLVEEQENARVFFSPIMITMPTCLKCHGVPGEDIQPEDYIILNSLYPNDQAVNFKMGDLRGMWRIDFPKDHEI